MNVPIALVAFLDRFAPAPDRPTIVAANLQVDQWGEMGPNVTALFPVVPLLAAVPVPVPAPAPQQSALRLPWWAAKRLDAAIPTA
mmetsp:Transcript_14404/g.36322  ORF Transcript_14404/g.36322 Transcript_14404/m.36322 type:complete len:85 (+) Transcript_14404:248-502(+)